MRIQQEILGKFLPAGSNPSAAAQASMDLEDSLAPDSKDKSDTADFGREDVDEDAAVEREYNLRASQINAKFL